MLKYRLQGTRQTINAGIKVILRSNMVEIVRISNLFQEKDSAKNYRVYLDVERISKMDERIRHENNEMCKRFFETKSAQFKRQ